MSAGDFNSLLVLIISLSPAALSAILYSPSKPRSLSLLPSLGLERGPNKPSKQNPSNKAPVISHWL